MILNFIFLDYYETALYKSVFVLKTYVVAYKFVCPVSSGLLLEARTDERAIRAWTERTRIVEDATALLKS